MSMNFSEFKKLIGAEPFNRDPETLRARNSAPEFEAAARDAEAFEQKLQAAVNIPAPSDLLNDIRAISQQPEKRRSWMPLALAASLLITVGAAAIIWQQMSSWDSVEEYVQQHYAHDGGRALAGATASVPDEDIVKIMSSLGAITTDMLSEKIRFIKICPTPDGKGAHMVVSTNQGPMTIIYMPETDVTDGEVISFEQQHALLVNLDKGSAAIIGDLDQSVEILEAMVRGSFKSMLIGA